MQKHKDVKDNPSTAMQKQNSLIKKLQTRVRTRGSMGKQSTSNSFNFRPDQA